MLRIFLLFHRSLLWVKHYQLLILDSWNILALSMLYVWYYYHRFCISLYHISSLLIIPKNLLPFAFFPCHFRWVYVFKVCSMVHLIHLFVGCVVTFLSWFCITFLRLNVSKNYASSVAVAYLWFILLKNLIIVNSLTYKYFSAWSSDLNTMLYAWSVTYSLNKKCFLIQFSVNIIDPVK